MLQEEHEIWDHSQRNELDGDQALDLNMWTWAADFSGSLLQVPERFINVEPSMTKLEISNG